LNQDQLLQDLHQQMRQCRLCLEAGYWIAPKAIFSGLQNAAVMTIGQAPGITEVEAGRPFNAGSGKRLFQWLEEAGFPEADFRARQYMTSVTKCYPGRAGSGSGDRVPSRIEQRLCLPFLQQEIEIVNPLLILPIGRLAINLFYPARQSLADIIGTENHEKGRQIIPLPHPSGASRWHQSEENRARIDTAVELIRRFKGANNL